MPGCSKILILLYFPQMDRNNYIDNFTFYRNRLLELVETHYITHIIYTIYSCWYIYLGQFGTYKLLFTLYNIHTRSPGFMKIFIPLWVSTKQFSLVLKNFAFKPMYLMFSDVYTVLSNIGSGPSDYNLNWKFQSPLNVNVSK